MWTAIAAIAAPLITAVVSVLTSRAGGGLAKRIKTHSETLREVDGIPKAQAALRSLIELQAQALLEAETARLARKLNPTNLALAIILLLVTGGSLYGLVGWTQAWWGQPWGFLPLLCLIVVGVFLLLLTAAGFTTIYNPPRPKKA